MPNRTKDDLWERQPGESAQAYEAFAIYRDMGSNRSLRVVAEQLSKSDTLIKRWSREKKWGERCRAYDNHLDDVARQEALRKYKKMRTRHIGIALQLQEKALAELKNLPDGSMTPKDIIQFLDKATELERDNRSPSSRRAWIEIQGNADDFAVIDVALLAEGVDRNNDELIDDKHHTSRPPRGGRG